MIGVGHCTLSSTGTRFRRRWHVGALPLRARLVLCHGTHEHSGRYDDLAAACCAKGIECFAVDLCGHGHSAGTQGDVESLDGAIDDVVALAVWANGLAPSVPLVVLGHSLGSMIACLAAHRLATDASLPTPAAVVLSGFAMDSESPPFGFRALIPVLRALPMIIRAIAGLLATVTPMGPACPLPPPSALTHCPRRVARTRSDPLHYPGWIGNRTAVCLLDARKRCHGLLSRWGAHFPFLLVHGELDTLCPPSACHAMMRASPQPDKQLRVFPGLYHEVLNEEKAAREAVQAAILEWLEPRIAAAAGEPRSRL